MIADGALVLNIFFTMGILASFQAVLTLPGIAGMVLTLGMAVDANVLIYERTKEELRAGKSLGKAIAYGSYPWFRYDDDHRFVRFIPYSRVLDSYRL